MKKLLIYIFCTLSYASSAQLRCSDTIAEKDVAFKNNEQLNYNVKYSSSLFTTSIADVSFSTYADATFYKVTAIGKTRPFFNTFFEMEDIYTTWLDGKTLRPTRTTSKIREGGYQYRSAFDYNWQSKNVKTFGQNIKSGNTYNRNLKLNQCSYDAISLFFNLRCIDISTHKYGVPYKLDLVLEDTIRTIQYRLIGREIKEIDKVGKFRTLKVACQIATESGDALKDGSEFYIWLTDDRNRIPIYMESPIRVGSIKVFLTNYVNLKHPVSTVQ